jgi:hypothetical protein
MATSVVTRLCAIALLGSSLFATQAVAAPPSALPAKIADVGGRQFVAEGPPAALFVPRMPVWVVEVDQQGRPGWPIAEAMVISVIGDRALCEVAEKDAGMLRVGALVEPRYVAEARQYRALPTPEAGKGETSGPVTPTVRARHRLPPSVQWGGRLWIETVIDGPADRAMAMFRLGDAGPYSELPLEPKGDGLFAAYLSVGETDPAIRSVQLYLVAVGPSGRFVVAGNPAEPLSVDIAAIPVVQEEQLVVHGPVDRASHRKPLVLTAQINKRFSNPTLFYRARGSGSYVALPMGQVSSGEYVAEIPAKDVVAPGLSYYIAVMDEKGVVRDGFGSNRDPWNVTVLQPQILSSEDNRNQLSLRYSWADFGQKYDRYHEVEAGLERLFFGFLVARLNGGLVSGKAVRPVSATDPQIPDALVGSDIQLYRGRAGLDLHMGDYLSAFGDVTMAIYSGGSGLGFRVGGKVGDEQVASIDLSMETIWDLATEQAVVDILKVSLTTPITDGWRLVGTAVQESVLQSATADSGLRLMLGVEADLGESWMVEATGGMSGRTGDAVGVTAGGGIKLKF